MGWDGGRERVELFVSVYAFTFCGCHSDCGGVVCPLSAGSNSLCWEWRPPHSKYLSVMLGQDKLSLGSF